MKILEKFRLAFGKIAALFTHAKLTPWASMNLHPEVQAAFAAALKPVERRATPSTFGTTSLGGNWYPRNRRYLAAVQDLPLNMQVPKKSPFTKLVTLQSGTKYMWRHGTLERVDRLAAAA